jgi:hypothetical protein
MSLWVSVMPRHIGFLVVTTAVEDDRRGACGSHGFEVESDQGVTHGRQLLGGRFMGPRDLEAEDERGGSAVQRRP